MGVKTNKNNLPSPILRNATKYGKNQIGFFFRFSFRLGLSIVPQGLYKTIQTLFCCKICSMYYVLYIYV